MPLKIRAKLIMAFLGIIFPFLLIVGVISIYNLSIIYKGIHKIEATTEQRARVTDLRFAIEGALMPSNDYIITGDRKYIDDFQKKSEGVEDRIKHVEEILAHPADIYKSNEKMEMLKDTKNGWQNIKELSLKIFEIPDPIGNRDAARLMEEIDYKWGYPPIERLKRWREIDMEEYSEAYEMSEKAWRQASIIMVAGSIILVALGVSFAMFYSKMFVKPIEAIHNGADAIAGGDFKTRLDIKTGDEIEQLSNAMNEMAAQLDSFTSNLQGMVEERTRELQESEDKYRTMIESANDMIWTVDREGLFTFINMQAVENAGYAVEEVIGKHYLTVIHPEDRAMREEYFKRTLSGERVQFTVRAFGKDHEERILILQVSSSPVYKEGKVVGMVNFGRDITELKKTEEALQESEERYRGIFEQTPNAMMIFDAETRRFENVNRGAIDLYGYTEEEFLSLTPMDVSAEVEKTKKAVQNGLAQKSIHVPIRYHKKKDGTVFPIEIFMGTFLSKGRPKGFAVIVDLTENKKNEEILMESKERYRVLGATAPNAIICLKAPDTITFWNRRAAEIFGYSEEEAVGRSMHDLIIPERYREKAGVGMKNFFQTGTGPVVGKRTELFALRRDGTEFPIELSISAMKIGGEWQATGIVQDITERKQAENGLRNSEERFRQLFEAGNDAVFVHGMTPDGKPTNFIEVNGIACKRLGYTKEELLKMSPLDIDAHEMANQGAVVIGDFLSNKKAVFEMVHVAKEGMHIPVEISSSLFEMKGQKIVLSIARDITDRKKAEAAIRREKDRAQMYLDVAGVMFVAIDPDEKVILINKKGCEVLGFGYDEIVGQNWFNTCIPEISRDDLKGAFTKLISGKDGSVEYFENPVLRKDGSLRIIAWHNTVIRNEAGDIVATLSSGEDITERKKAEDEVKKDIDELERFQKITVKREFRIKELNDEVKELKLRLELLEKK